MTTKPDVVVVGAGPAGSMTAYHLAKRGVRVALVDGAVFPREKACGGGIQHKSVRFLPEGWQKTERGQLTGMGFSYRCQDRFARMGTKPLVYSVLRKEFDQFLLDAAVSAGAEAYLGVKVESIAVGDRRVDVRGPNLTLETRFVVGADGANSVVRSQVSSRKAYFWQAGLYCEVPAELVRLDGDFKHCMTVDWATLPNGYGWVFPKNGTVNIGVGCPSSMGKLLRPYLGYFLEREGLLDQSTYEALNFRGHQLPTASKNAAFSKGRVVLVGDAAGLVEPFTGDGISYAVHSAEIAAGILIDGLESDSVDHGEYRRRLKQEILIELEYAGKLQRFFVAFPYLVHNVLRNNDKVWAAFCRVLRGEESYKTLRVKRVGPFEFLWAPVDAYSALVAWQNDRRQGLRESAPLLNFRRSMYRFTKYV